MPYSENLPGSRKARFPLLVVLQHVSEEEIAEITRPHGTYAGHELETTIVAAVGDVLSSEASALS